MTMAMSWVRSVGDTEEMVVASDSRLRMGGHWDCCPKIVQLPRLDSALCFSGNTMYAYPVMIQAINLVNMHFKLSTRGMSLTEFRGHLVRVLNHMMTKVGDLPREDEQPGTEFILSGYCCHSRAFKAWKIHFDPHLKRFTHRPSKRWKGGNQKKILTFTGDYEDEFHQKLVELLRSKGKLGSGGFDMEPFEVLRDMLREGTRPDIGGAPQLVKIYRNINTIPFGVPWDSNGTTELCLLGRPLLDYERHNHLNIDTDSLLITEM